MVGAHLEGGVEPHLGLHVSCGKQATYLGEVLVEEGIPAQVVVVSDLLRDGVALERGQVGAAERADDALVQVQLFELGG